jgi:hypothetical protein
MSAQGCSASSAVRPWKRFRLFFAVAVVVLALSAAKVGVHAAGAEFLTLNTLLTSGIAGAIFIIGFLLSAILADYKEAERIPAELRVALEAINSDVQIFAVIAKDADAAARCADISARVIDLLRSGLGHDGGHANLAPVVAEIGKFSALFASLEVQVIPSNAVVRLRNAQDSLRRSVLRIYHIQRVQFVPSVHVLVHTLVIAIILLLLFLKTEGSPESALMFGFISYMFVYALYLVRLLEQPFMKDHSTFDDVSLFLLSEFREGLKLTTELPPARQRGAL